MLRLLSLVSAAVLTLGPAAVLWPPGGPEPARADDSPMFHGPFGLSPGLPGVRVQMAAEQVDIEVLELGGRCVARVRAWFDLYNPGPATSMLVGFPGMVGRDNYSGLMYFHPVMESFRAWTEDVSFVPHEEKVQDQSHHLTTWYVWEMDFPSEQTVRSYVSYDLVLSDRLDRPDQRWVHFASRTILVEYILSTGAYWDGNIGQADIAISSPQGALTDAWPEGADALPRRVSWHLRDFKPTQNIVVLYVTEALHAPVAAAERAIENGTATIDDYVEGARGAAQLCGEPAYARRAMEWASFVTDVEPTNAGAWEVVGEVEDCTTSDSKKGWPDCRSVRAAEAYRKAINLGSTTAANKLEVRERAEEFAGRTWGLEDCK
jgi:hypothetical protein